MFGLEGMIGNYESRKIDLTVVPLSEGEMRISTVRNTDSDHPYETAVKHPQYNDGNWVVVQEYDDRVSAQAGHADWLERMTDSNPPNQLVDVSSCEILKLIDSPKLIRPRKE